MRPALCCGTTCALARPPRPSSRSSAPTPGPTPSGACRWRRSRSAKLRWLAEHEPDNAVAPQAVCLPHDWLTWKLLGSDRRHGPGSSRSRPIAAMRAAPATGRRSPASTASTCSSARFGRVVAVPRVLGPAESPGTSAALSSSGAGAGDNAVGRARPRPDGPATSSSRSAPPASCSASSDVLMPDSSGHGRRLRRRDRALPAARLHGERLPASSRPSPASSASTKPGLSELALSAPPGADGLVLLPYLEGERTPNLPDATGELHGLRLKTSTPAHLARAAVEGVLCGLADALDAVEARGVDVERVHLIGGGSRSEALRRIAPTVFGRPVLVPPPGRVRRRRRRLPGDVGARSDSQPQPWVSAGSLRFDADPCLLVRARYGEVRDRYRPLRTLGHEISVRAMAAASSDFAQPEPRRAGHAPGAARPPAAAEAAQPRSCAAADRGVAAICRGRSWHCAPGSRKRPCRRSSTP